jgi:hypothetical protein
MRNISMELVPSFARDSEARCSAFRSRASRHGGSSCGLYEVYERLVGAELDTPIIRLRATPEVRLARHYDGPRVHGYIESLLRARIRVGIMHRRVVKGQPAGQERRRGMRS